MSDLSANKPANSGRGHTRMVVTLPWPSPKLNPNARVHWAQLAKVKAEYRALCFKICKEAGFRPGIYREDVELRLSLEFVPPTKARRDLDNCLSSMKAGIDGLSDALQVDDSRFSIALRIANGRTGGYVFVAVEAFQSQVM